MSLAVSVIRMVGVLATIVISWWLSPNDTGWLISAGIVSLLPVIAAMLLWSVDVKELAIGVASSLAIIAACAWGRNRRVKGNYRSFHKKRNR